MAEVSISGNNGTVTGTTTASYVVAKRIQGYGGPVGKTIIHVTNLSGATTTMYYKINGYISCSSAATAVTAETDVVNTTVVVDTAADKPYDHIDVLVKNHSGACSYQIDHMTY